MQVPNNRSFDRSNESGYTTAMILAALIIGAMSAYYLGLRNGVIAAGVSMVLFVAAAAVPGVSLYVYAAVALGLVGLATVGPKLRPKYGLDARALGALRTAVGRLRGLFKG